MSFIKLSIIVSNVSHLSILFLNYNGKIILFDVTKLSFSFLLNEHNYTTNINNHNIYLFYSNTVTA